MKIRIPSTLFYQVLFILCIIVPYFNRYELTFVTWLFTGVITINTRYSVSILKQVACFSAILLIAAIVTFFYEYRLYYIIRDITYLLKPIIGLLVGYQLSRKMNGEVFKLIILAGVIVALLHYIKLAHGIVVMHASTVNKIREYGGYFSDFEVYALIILLFNRKFGLSIPQKYVLWLGIFIGLSIFMYLARTNFIQLIVLWLAVKGYFRITRRSIIIVSSVLTASIIAYGAILYINPKRNGKGLEALMYKIKIAPTEPFKTRLNRDNWREFNDNYRSYENIMTLRQVPAEGVDAIVFGKGLGSTIDLRIEVWLADQMMRYISIMHNGFMTVFLKAGLLGVAFFILSIYLLFKKTLGQHYLVHSLNDLMIGSGVFMIMSAWVFMGFYFLADTKSILIGMFIFSREFFSREKEE